jgi:hypothetical protein
MGIGMRPDMAKVIVERPRKTNRRKPKGYRRKLQRYGDDGGPSHEGIKRCWLGGTKWLNEHLGPLRRYLDKQVGRPWDKVYSEICAHISRNSAVQGHVRDHVDGYVAVHVLLIDGVPCNGTNWGYGKPLHEWRQRRWYVCPRTGLLRRVELPRKLNAAARMSEPPAYVKLGDSLQCRFYDNAWHLVTVMPMPDPFYQGQCGAVDVLLKRRVKGITREQARQQYGAEVYAVATRRLTRRELRHYPIPTELWV